MFYVQHKHFREEFQILRKIQKGYGCKITVSTRKLDPIIVDGLLRVGGRLDRVSILYEMKHQLFLSKDYLVIKSILMDIHKSVGYMGKNSILAVLREKY